MKVRPRGATDEPTVTRFLHDHGSERVARLGELLHPLDYPAVIAEEEGRLLGVLTYIVDGGRCEVLTLHAAEQWRGVGTALLHEVERIASHHGCTRLWLITTNDNLDGLRFYQRRGFEHCVLHRGAVDEDRARLKPEIPTEGEHGIPLRDELELEASLAGGNHHSPGGAR